MTKRKAYSAEVDYEVIDEYDRIIDPPPKKKGFKDDYEMEHKASKKGSSGRQARSSRAGSSRKSASSSSKSEAPRSTQRSVERQHRNHRETQRRLVIFGVICVAVAIVTSISISTIVAQRNLRTLREQEEALNKQYQQELELSQKLKEQKEYVNTDDYIEEMARKMGLLYPNEIIFKPQE